MFLTFTKPEKRVALSPSIAAKEIPDEKKDRYQEYWKGFSARSVREEQSAELIRDISGREAQVLIDPTIAIDREKWDKLEKEAEIEIKGKYILVYLLGKGRVNDQITEYAQSKEYSVVDLFDRPYIKCGPCEFLRLIKHAKLVVTDSYHGTIFSMIFHVPFCVLEREGKGPDMSSRFDTLFRKMGLNASNFRDIDQSQDIDFGSIDDYVEIEKKKMRAYLDNVLSKSCIKKRNHT